MEPRGHSQNPNSILATQFMVVKKIWVHDFVSDGIG